MKFCDKFKFVSRIFLSIYSLIGTIAETQVVYVLKNMFYSFKTVAVKKKKNDSDMHVLTDTVDGNVC